MQSYLSSLNDWLDYTIRRKGIEISTASKCLYHAGLLVPIGSRDIQKGVRVIMSIRPELSKIFNTKTRAPYLVVFETVSLEEVKEKLGMLGTGA